MYYFIINPKARSGMGTDIWRQVRRELNQRRIPYKAFLTGYAGHARTIAADLTENLSECISLNVIGGDGTINEVLDGIEDFGKVIFGYIPTGSGNDFCRGMRIPSDPMEALDAILSRSALASIDVGYLEVHGRRHHFAVSCGIGLDAAVCQEVLAAPLKKYLNRLGFGKLIYLFVALKQLFLIRPGTMELRLDGGRTFHFDGAYFAAVMNQKYEGGGFQMCPQASPRDHVLDVIVVEHMSKLKLLFCLPTAFFGKHTIFQGVHIFRCKQAEIVSPVPLCVHKDGESGGIASEISAGIEKNSLKVVISVL